MIFAQPHLADSLLDLAQKTMNRRTDDHLIRLALHPLYSTAGDLTGLVVSEVSGQEKMAQKLQLKPTSKLCDIGCGYGETSRLLNRKFGSSVTGVTISQKQIEHAEAHAVENVKIILEDWMHTKIPSNSIDFAYAIESSEHMPSLATFFDQAYRVLKPGGKLAVFAWLENSVATEIERKYLLAPVCDEGRMHIYTRKEYEANAVAGGFGAVEFEDMSEKVSRTWTLCTTRLIGKLLTNRGYQEFILSSAARNRIFALRVPRIRLAYATGAMRYGLFIFTKPVNNA